MIKEQEESENMTQEKVNDWINSRVRKLQNLMFKDF